MAKYIHVSTGLRGCYMPDSSYVLKVSSRRELKDAIQDEANNYLGDGGAGASRKAVAGVAAAMWRALQSKRPPLLPYALPLKPEGCGSYSHGVFVSAASRADWVEYQNSEG